MERITRISAKGVTTWESFSR